MYHCYSQFMQLPLPFLGTLQRPSWLLPWALLIKSLPTFMSAVSYALQPGEPPMCHFPADCEILPLFASPWKIFFRNLRFHGARHTKTSDQSSTLLDIVPHISALLSYFVHHDHLNQPFAWIFPFSII